jgi:predicted P-loop ATPase
MISSPDAIIRKHATLRAIDGEVGSDSDWRSHLLLKQNGDARSILANVIMALRLAPEWSGVLGYDAFGLAAVALREPPWGTGRNSAHGAVPWTARDDVLAANWLQHNGIMVGHELAQVAVELVAQDNKFHPIRDYLDGLQWDGQPRVGHWLSSYVGAHPTAYVSAVGEKFLISAVARVQKPGCKADQMLVLEGSQGVGKSTTLSILGGQWFSDELADVGSKDAAMQVRAAWILEVSELDALGRREVATIKAFISRSTDRFRPPYGRRVIEAPRQSVFAGSTNADSYLRDETGGRRFWPVRIHQIDRDALEKDRDQLWAEAAYLYRSGLRWWLDERVLIQDAAREQEARYSGDPWDELIRTFVESRSSVTVGEVLELLLHIDRGKWTQADQNRVARVLRSLGFERKHKRDASGRYYEYRRGDFV